MELCNFKGTLYGKVQHQLFVWEPTWDSFRPIERIGWNGNAIVPVFSKYTVDLFDPWYGYGSSDMKQLCKRLSEITELGIPESQTVKWVSEEWWRDRKCAFAYECTPRSKESWNAYVKYMKSKPKTLRRHVHSRATKRLLPK